jgi:hypothetical protein
MVELPSPSPKLALFAGSIEGQLGNPSEIFPLRKLLHLTSWQKRFLATAQPLPRIEALF